MSPQSTTGEIDSGELTLHAARKKKGPTGEVGPVHEVSVLVELRKFTLELRRMLLVMLLEFGSRSKLLGQYDYCTKGPTLIPPISVGSFEHIPGIQVERPQRAWLTRQGLVSLARSIG